MKRSHALAGILVASMFGAATYAFHASGTSDNHQNHSDHGAATAGQKLPVEVGQAAFASIAEIVQLLNDDPKTDWKLVNINRLREHLVDMATLTTEAMVDQKSFEDAVEFRITGTGPSVRAIHKMVPAHAAELNKTTKWNATTNKLDDGIMLRLAPKEPLELQKLAALGFFGIMATGAHHQAHHLAMARGDSHGH